MCQILVSKKEKDHFHLAFVYVLLNETFLPPTDSALLHIFAIDTSIVALFSHNLEQWNRTSVYRSYLIFLAPSKPKRIVVKSQLVESLTAQSTKKNNVLPTLESEVLGSRWIFGMSHGLANLYHFQCQTWQASHIQVAAARSQGEKGTDHESRITN